MNSEALSRFLDALAADPPGPAAGSAAAVTVAMAGALTEMVARRSGDDSLASRAANVRARALHLADADARAYEEVLRSRDDARRRALERASDVLREVAASADEVRALASALVDKARPPLAGDARAARQLADAARLVTEQLVLVNENEASTRDRWALRRRAELSQGEVAWDVHGAGPAVVLVHGTPTWSYLWRNIVPRLAADFTVYVFDLPGYGDSTVLADDVVSIETHARALVELLERWRLDDPAIAGHDIGGAAVLRAHLIHGQRFRRIALIDAVALAPWITPTTRHIKAHLDAYRTMPPHVFERITAGHLRTAVHRELEAETFAAYHDRWRGEPGQEAYLRKIEGFDEAHTREFEPLLGTIEVPVRVIWGTEDAWLAPSVGERLRDSIPHAELTLIEDAGHFSMEDAPSEVEHALAEFFRGAP